MIKAVLFDADGVIQSASTTWHERLAAIYAARARPVEHGHLSAPVAERPSEDAPRPAQDGDGIAESTVDGAPAASAAVRPQIEASDLEFQRFVDEVFAAEAPSLTGDGDFALALKDVLERWQIALPVREVMDRVWHQINVHHEILALVDAQREAGRIVCLASNQQAYRAQFMTLQLDYLAHFDHCFYSHALGHTKSSAHFFTSVVAHLGLTPAEVLMIDDQPNVLASAKACGLATQQFVFGVDDPIALGQAVSGRVAAAPMLDERPVVLHLNGLAKSYRGVTALADLDMTVREGQIYGFLGRNGAGKSTAMRIIMGIIEATRGTVELLGQRLTGDTTELRRQIGYVAQEQHFYGWMTPLTVGEFVAGFYPNWDDAEYARLLDQFALPRTRKLATFSGGMTAKLAFALALAHKPRLLLLDEPTAGMDAVARREFVEILRDQARSEQRTTLFSSHLIDEVEVAADTVGVVADGKLLFEGSLDQLRFGVQGFELRAGSPAIGDHLDDVSLPFGLAGATDVEVLRDRSLDGIRSVVVRGDTPGALARLIAGPWRRIDLSLEDIFVAMVTPAGDSRPV